MILIKLPRAVGSLVGRLNNVTQHSGRAGSIKVPIRNLLNGYLLGSRQQEGLLVAYPHQIQGLTAAFDPTAHYWYPQRL